MDSPTQSIVFSPSSRHTHTARKLNIKDRVNPRQPEIISIRQQELVKTDRQKTVG